MKKITLTLITAVYNGEKTIQETIESVIHQSVFSDIALEHIIVDGNSTDGTIDIVKKYAKQYSHIRYQSEPDNGIYDAFNKGLTLARGDIIGIINADDFYCTECFEHVLNVFEQNQNVDIVHGDLLIEYQDKKRLVSKPSLKKYSHYFFMPFNHPTCFVKASTYSQIGKFDTQYRIAGDYEFILRALKAGKKTYYIAENLAVFRYGGASTENLAYKERVSIRTKHGIPKPLGHLIVFTIDAKRYFKKILISLGLK